MTARGCTARFGHRAGTLGQIAWCVSGDAGATDPRTPGAVWRYGNALEKMAGIQHRVLAEHATDRRFLGSPAGRAAVCQLGGLFQFADGHASVGHLLATPGCRLIPDGENQEHRFDPA